MTFRKLLAETGRPVLGTFVKLPSIEIAELVGDAGFDFVVIDTEHALLSVRDVYELVVVYSRLGVSPLVRITDHGYGDAQRYLDAGAGGILVPHVSNARQAEETMRQYRFPPEGTRGMGFAARVAGWGAIDGGVPEYLRAGAEDVARVAMIEEAEAIESIEQIIAVPGVDAVFIGPGDLSLSLGHPGGSHEVERAVRTAIDAAVRGGTPVGTVVPTPAGVADRVRQGCSFVLVSNDTGMIRQAASEIVASVRGVLAEIDGTMP